MLLLYIAPPASPHPTPPPPTHGNEELQIKSVIKNQCSTESADGGGCLNFYRPLELIGMYI